jgi:hypothetical protein
MGQNLTNLYDALIEMVQKEMPLVAMCKSDITEFEIHPAIGFGLPGITPTDLVSGENMVQLKIQTVIEHYGGGAQAVEAVLQMYEDLNTLINTKLKTYLDNHHVNYAYPKLDLFQQNMSVADQSIRGLIGNLNIIIEL